MAKPNWNPKPEWINHRYGDGQRLQLAEGRFELSYSYAMNTEGSYKATCTCEIKIKPVPHRDIAKRNIMLATRTRMKQAIAELDELLGMSGAPDKNEQEILNKQLSDNDDAFSSKG